MLDVGCGDGYYTRQIALENDVFGIDVLPQNILGIRFSRGDVEDIRVFPKEKFDVVVCTEIIEHLLQPEKVLENIKTVLKPNGRVIVSTPNYGHWQTRMRFLFGKQIQSYNDMHIRLFNYSMSEKLFSDTGFKIVEFEGFLTNTIFKTISKKVFCRVFIFVLKADK